ncbi:mercuric ion binding protein [Anoxybacillus voinovskiensis]|uniref:Mercuric ion binding protein n=1 Tax=Anoxybacteroides voinovskiense TaxID=230470 RepID=A0A840DY55_9BACL|nr:heavy metal-associated domain-containing protein [Anoxybacillus voinovskiensis]MBB4075457.1 mercuric ion binding protein [Anoxybacillus voinovskiensis]GGJ79474.1 hypothetical protein GCM10008982_31070 [Anoxybacillus voinovskiensis]
MMYKKIMVNIFFTLFLFTSACSNPKDIDITNSNQSISFTVANMYCTSCPFVVEHAIKRINGVRSVTVKSTGTEGKVTVFFDDTKTDIETIKKSVLELGYGIE